MKKLFGLMAVISLVACSDTSDPASALQNNTGAVPTSSETVQPVDQSSAAVPPASSAAAVPQTIVDPTTGAQLVLINAETNLYYNTVTGQTYNATLQSYVDPNTGLPIVESSSSSVVIVPVSSSTTAPIVTPTSSATPVAKSSSSKVTPKSSAAVVADDGNFNLELWDAAAGDPQVVTGNANGGWWYDYANTGSEVTWAAELGTGGDKTPVLEACGGICGDYEIGGTDKYPYLGIAFDYNKTGTAADASALKGVCVTYTFSGDNDFALELGMTEAQENKLGSALPMYILPAGTKKTVDVAWSDFEQPTWAETVMTGAKAAAQLKSLKFKVVDPVAGDAGSFAIYMVGPKGSCN